MERQVEALDSDAIEACGATAGLHALPFQDGLEQDIPLCNFRVPNQHFQLFHNRMIARCCGCCWVQWPIAKIAGPPTPLSVASPLLLPIPGAGGCFPACIRGNPHKLSPVDPNSSPCATYRRCFGGERPSTRNSSRIVFLPLVSWAFAFLLCRWC